MKQEPIINISDNEVQNRIVELLKNNSEGMSNSKLQQSLSDVLMDQRVKGINILLKNVKN